MTLGKIAVFAVFDEPYAVFTCAHHFKQFAYLFKT